MGREGARNLTLSILVVAAIALVADCAWLHAKCSRQAEALAALEAKVEAHLNPPPEPSVTDKAKETYERAKVATVAGYEKAVAAATNGYESAKAATVRQYEKVKTAASAGLRAVKKGCGGDAQ